MCECVINPYPSKQVMCTWTESAERWESSHLKAVFFWASRCLNVCPNGRRWRIIYIFLVWFPFFSLSLPSRLVNKSWHIFNVVNMYWTASAIHAVFCKASLGLGWLTWMDVQTRWCYMDVETRNICFCDHDQKMWFKYYTECIPFGFMLFPDNNRPIVNDSLENGG